MRSQNWIALGFAAAVIAACGGSVSLGDLGGANLSDGGGGAEGGDGAVVECASVTNCGPAPKSPAIQCSDGSLGGNTGRCLQTASGCAWEQRECPPTLCFDPAGALFANLKKCASAADCVVVSYQANCCGSMHAAGVSAAHKAAVEKCAADRAVALPECECATSPPIADDGSSAATDSSPAAVSCNGSGQCETTFKEGPVCGATTCKPGGTCCTGVPFPTPTCIDTGACPVSRRKYKKDITYLSQTDRERLNDELLQFPLATYRYKSENDSDAKHLGFIIDDVAPTAAVLEGGERVDMYGYQTMTVAALQVQARELAALRREVEELKAACAKKR
jgi:hypothetical protein